MCVHVVCLYCVCMCVLVCVCVCECACVCVCMCVCVQGDHNLAMQILKHEWHKVQEEDKNKVCQLWWAWLCRHDIYDVKCRIVLEGVGLNGAWSFSSME